VNSPEQGADELVERVLEKERRSIADGLDYSEREIRVAVRNMSRPIAIVPIGLGMITATLRHIRFYLGVVVVLLIILICVVLLK